LGVRTASPPETGLLSDLGHIIDKSANTEKISGCMMRDGQLKGEHRRLGGVMGAQPARHSTEAVEDHDK
jgi:hypothetical protein